VASSLKQKKELMRLVRPKISPVRSKDYAIGVFISRIAQRTSNSVL